MFHQSQATKKNISLQLATAWREELTRVQNRGNENDIGYSFPKSAGMWP